MKKIINFLNATTLLVVLTFTSSSCQKEISKEDAGTDAKGLLTAKTWQMQQVTTVENGISTIEFKRGAQNNLNDYSKMRLTFKPDGSMIFIDELGDQLNNASYVLLNDNKNLKITVDGFPITFENLAITANQFSVKEKIADNEYSLYIFTPAL
ncbi:MAG: hypothetical protein IPJ81_07615 [Chitinophagaceae bacterium]|nr:hypothetical protein [Chitinophagaceae bacterium]